MKNPSNGTRTAVDGTGAPSLASKPGAVAWRQGGDHCFENMSIKFIPEPGKQKNMNQKINTTQSPPDTMTTDNKHTNCKHLPSSVRLLWTLTGALTVVLITQVHAWLHLDLSLRAASCTHWLGCLSIIFKLSHTAGSEYLFLKEED